MGMLDEEFNNFMFKVNEVSSIMQKLNSTDKEVQRIGDLEAQRYLGDNRETVLEKLDEQNVQLKIKSNRTLVNKNALKSDDKDQATMSQEAFMEQISKDADKRYKDRLVRKEKMETFKKQATLAFRRGEYEKALSLYSKAIEQIKDSCLLYNNRALTHINLKLYDKAKDDLDWALRLNEDCLKSWLLLAKVNFFIKDHQEYKRAIGEALARNPENKNFIKEYVAKLEEQCNDSIDL
ncbi:tetratricopeptide repeat protein 12-like [Anoplophora glabripennis]|uniref:tetratricopeptide repeat protein 12-like n=1 Tax=Anoplophora glabripennis TaxID=217634 RepID=UPI000873E77F|nr:tetratricopeptide repeat protein 12-like [Anoplophora glabripennis]